MTTHDERQRLAAMASALRPDWPVRSLYTLLTDDEVLVKRAYRDVATALAWIGTDPETKTPARLKEPGPWWSATVSTKAGGPVLVAPGRHEACGGFHAPSAPCNPPDNHRVGPSAVSEYVAAKARLKGGTP